MLLARTYPNAGEDKGSWVPRSPVPSSSWRTSTYQSCPKVQPVVDLEAKSSFLESHLPHSALEASHAMRSPPAMPVLLDVRRRELEARAMERRKNWGTLSISWLAKNSFAAWRLLTWQRHRGETQNQVTALQDIGRAVAEKDTIIQQLYGEMTRMQAKVQQGGAERLLASSFAETDRCTQRWVLSVFKWAVREAQMFRECERLETKYVRQISDLEARLDATLSEMGALNERLTKEVGKGQRLELEKKRDDSQRMKSHSCVQSASDRSLAVRQLAQLLSAWVRYTGHARLERVYSQRSQEIRGEYEGKLLKALEETKRRDHEWDRRLLRLQQQHELQLLQAEEGCSLMRERRRRLEEALVVTDRTRALKSLVLHSWVHLSERERLGRTCSANLEDLEHRCRKQQQLAEDRMVDLDQRWHARHLEAAGSWEQQMLELQQSCAEAQLVAKTHAAAALQRARSGGLLLPVYVCWVFLHRCSVLERQWCERFSAQDTQGRNELRLVRGRAHGAAYLLSLRLGRLSALQAPFSAWLWCTLASLKLQFRTELAGCKRAWGGTALSIQEAAVRLTLKREVLDGWRLLCKEALWERTTAKVAAGLRGREEALSLRCARLWRRGHLQRALLSWQNCAAHRNTEKRWARATRSHVLCAVQSLLSFWEVPAGVFFAWVMHVSMERLAAKLQRSAACARARSSAAQQRMVWKWTRQRDSAMVGAVVKEWRRIAVHTRTEACLLRQLEETKEQEVRVALLRHSLAKKLWQAQSQTYTFMVLLVWRQYVEDSNNKQSYFNLRDMVTALAEAQEVHPLAL